MSKPVVFVIGATGNIGSATLRNLSSKYREKVEIRAGVRNPEKAEALKSLPGVEVVKATMGDEALAETFSGVDTLYIVTPTAENRVALTNSTADCAKKAGVKHIGVVSSTGAAIPDIYLGQHFLDIEKHIAGLGIPYTSVRLPFFMENIFGYKQSVIAQNAIHSGVKPDLQIGAIISEDAGNASAAILVNPKQYSNKILSLYSDSITFNDVVKELSAALGREISYVLTPLEVLNEVLGHIGVPEWQKRGMLEFMKTINEASAGFDKIDLSTYSEITGESPTTLKAWVAKHSACFQPPTES